MATATLSNVLFDTTGSGASGINVRIQLVASSGFLSDSTAEVITYYETASDDSGAWTAPITPLDQMEDPDAYYQVTEGRKQWAVNVPTAGDYNLRPQIINIPTSNPGGGGGVSNFLTGVVSPPSSSLGVDGDAYLDTTHANLYHKVSGAWVGPTSLTGPAGSGVTSVQGKTGPVITTLAPTDLNPAGILATDTRLTNARNPTSHAASHALGGSDQVTVSATGAASIALRPVDVKDQANALTNAVMDGNSHPLSTRFATLGAAQAVFPGVTALTDEIDFWAIQFALNSGADYVRLGVGTAVVHKSLTLPVGGNVTIEGQGTGASVIFLRSGSNSNIISTDSSGLNPGITLRGFTVDGNNAGNTTASIPGTDNILLTRCDNLHVEDVESRNGRGSGIHHHGLTGDIVQYQTWSRIYCHNNQHWGLHNSNGVRIVDYNDIKCISNGLRTDMNLAQTGNGADSFTGGFLLDHSEVVARGIQCHLNGQEGLWMRNLFDGNVSDVNCTRNGRHGIRVLGFVNSYGNGWVAQGNGTNLTLVGHDIWFDGTNTLNYNITSRSLIEGLLAGPNLAAAIASQGHWVGNEDYGIWFDDLMNTADLTVRGKVYPGTVGDVRLPATIGTLDWNGSNIVTGGGPPSNVTAVTVGTVTSTSVALTWGKSTAVTPATILSYTVYATQTGGTDNVPPVVLAVVPRADYTANGGVTVLGLSPSTSYLVGVKATDSTGDDSPTIVTAPATFTTLASTVPDTAPPSAPTAFTAPVVAATEIDLAWASSTDPPPNATGVQFYTLYINGTPTGDVITNTSFAVTGLTPSTSYQFQVTASDGATPPNESNPSVTLTKSTTAAVVLSDTDSAFTTVAGPLVVTVPATTRTGDLLLLTISAPGPGTTFTTPASFTILPGTTVTDAGTESSATYYRLAPGTTGQLSSLAGTTLSTTPSGSPSKSVANLIVYTGVNQTTPIDSASARPAPSSEADHTFTPVVTTFNSTVLAGFLSEKDAATNVTTITPSSGWTSGAGIVATAGVSQQLGYAAFNPAILPPGQHGQNVHFVADQATANAVTWLVALVPAGGDGIRPTTPTGLTSSQVGANQLTLSWNAATDAGGISGYKLYWDNHTGTLLTAPKQTLGNVLSVDVSGLTASTAYKFAVSAVDNAGNESATKSSTVTVTTASTGATPLIIYGINAAGGGALNTFTAANNWVTNDSTSPPKPFVDTSGASVLCGMTRVYYSGTLPTTFHPEYTTSNGGTNTYKRVNQCVLFRTNNSDGSMYTGQGTPAGNITHYASPAEVISGLFDDRLLQWCIDVPSDWEVAFTWHHEPNGELVAGTGVWSPLNYMKAWQRIGALISGSAMPAGQVIKQSSRSGSSITANIYSSICYTITRDGSNNSGSLIIPSIPNASTMDPNAKLNWDAYQNPPPGGSTSDNSFTTPGTIFNWFFGTSSNSATAPTAGAPFNTLGYNTAAHGYMIGEWGCPYGQTANATGQQTARPGATGAQQAAAMESYLNYLENFNPRPYAILGWTGQGTKFDQTYSTESRHMFVNHCNGPAHRI